MKPEHFAPSWHAAVELAEEDFYEPDTDEYRWTGGFSGDGTHIGVCALVDGHKMTVDTLTGGRRLDDHTIQRFEISTLLSRHVNHLTAPITLPLHVTVEAEDRHITVGTMSLIVQAFASLASASGPAACSTATPGSTSPPPPRDRSSPFGPVSTRSR